MYCIKICILALFTLWSTNGLLSQTYGQILDELEELESVDEKLKRIEQVISNGIFQGHTDTIALLYIEKSYILFRNNVSIGQSIAALDEGLNYVTLQDHKETWLELWYYKGYWYRKWDKYKEAKEALNNVLDIKEDNPLEWSATIQLGKTYKDRGDFALALDTYDKAILLSGQDKDKLTDTYEVISFVYLIMDSKEGAENAIPWLEKLIALLNTMEDEEHFKGSMTYNLGTAYQTLNDLQNAEKYYAKAEKIINDCCKDNDLKSLLLESRASILASQGKYQESLDIFDKAMELYEESFDLTRSDGLASTYHQVADVHRMNNSPAQALEFINRALGYRLAGIDPQEESVSISIERLRSNGEKHYLIDELLTKSKILKDQYKDSNKIQKLQEALQVLEYCDLLVDLMRFEQIEESSKFFWREKTNEVYDLLVETNFNLDQKEEAFHYSEKAKYLLTGEHLVQKNPDDHTSSISPELFEKYQVVQSAVDRAVLYKQDLEVSGKKSEKDSIDFVISDLRKSQDDVLTDIRTHYPEYYNSNFTFSIATIDEVQHQILDDAQLLIEFFVHDDELYTFSISKSDFNVDRQSDAKELLKNVVRLREVMTSEQRMTDGKIKSYASISHKIFTKTIGSSSDQSSYADIIIVNDDVLSLIPYAILLTEEVSSPNRQQLGLLPYLIKDKKISYLQSTSLLLHLGSEKPNYRDHQILACRPSFGKGSQASDEFRGSLEPLYGAEQELIHLKASTNGDFLENNAANESRIKSALRHPYSVVHFASHAVVDNLNPEFSKLVLHEDGNEDGYLHAYEIQNMTIESDLIVLSACNTGFGKLEKGEGINSLGNAFVRAGSPNLLTSLWPVSDKSSADLMTRFYNELFEGHSIKNSLHQSQVDFFQSMPSALQHPYYWGGFVYYGDNRSINFTAKSRFQPWWFLVGGVGLLGFIFCFKQLR